MTTQLLTLMKKNLRSPDEIREFSRGKIEFVHLGDTTVSRITLQPGWKWSDDVKPLARTDSCMIGHVQYVLSGRLTVRMDDGMEGELVPGDAVVIPPGHDAWVSGEEPCVLVDFGGMKDYARESPSEIIDTDTERYFDLEGGY
jgi:uncharacterized cupin superfamily protein